ncbi:MAG: precorrin-6A reductase [Faecousia sp.]
MYKICVFAGTTEGRELIEFLSTQAVSVTACVATEYGEALLPSADNLTVSARRLPVQEIIGMLQENTFHLVIDATHPYAASITRSIAAACAQTGTEYLRLLRGASSVPEDAVYVADMASAVRFLNTTEGNVLLTTGSKELGAFSQMEDFAERVYARVLPMEASLASCRTAGVKPSHIIAMQGPFSREMNEAVLRYACAKWMITKDGGDVGGFEAKAAAARETGARMVVIGRPPQREGVDFSQTVELLCKRFGCVWRPQVSIVSLGPGSRGAMTADAQAAIDRADCLIGAGRMLDAVAAGQARYSAIDPKAIADFILAHREYRRFAVVMSGDTGFFSGAKKLLPLLKDCDTEVIPGVSSLVTLCARLQTSYEDVYVTSLHGRDHNIVPDVRANRRVFALVGGENGIGQLCTTLTQAGLGHVTVHVGQRLSYPDEQITSSSAAELADGTYDSLSAALIENEAPDAVVTHGLPDAAFLREETVPMTKSEVRSVCLSKLRLTENAVCWDVGAGTGSVAIEMALQAKRGWVYAIERKDAAGKLLEENKAAFSAENLTVVPGCAPEACQGLPAPTHVFIGGSGGNLRQIVALILQKNPHARILATAITLESIAELTDCMKAFPFTETEVVSMMIARDRRAGAYHLMTGQNPIYIFTMQAGGDRV